MGLLGRLYLGPVDEQLGIDLNSGARRQSQAGRTQVPDSGAGGAPVLLNLAREEVTGESRSLLQTLLQSSDGKDADLALGRSLGTSCLGGTSVVLFSRALTPTTHSLFSPNPLGLCRHLWSLADLDNQDSKVRALGHTGPLGVSDSGRRRQQDSNIRKKETVGLDSLLALSILFLSAS